MGRHVDFWISFCRGIRYVQIVGLTFKKVSDYCVRKWNSLSLPVTIGSCQMHAKDTEGTKNNNNKNTCTFEDSCGKNDSSAVRKCTIFTHTISVNPTMWWRAMWWWCQPDHVMASNVMVMSTRPCDGEQCDGDVNPTMWWRAMWWWCQPDHVMVMSTRPCDGEQCDGDVNLTMWWWAMWWWCQPDHVMVSNWHFWTRWLLCDARCSV